MPYNEVRDRVAHEFRRNADLQDLHMIDIAIFRRAPSPARGVDARPPLWSSALPESRLGDLVALVVEAFRSMQW